MCGIGGILNARARPSRSLLKRMADAMIHRGPDDEGIATSGPCGFVNRRLSIIDTTPAGHQPFANLGLYLTYNGEIYNYRELKEELKGHGHHFRSETDTEVILHGYEQWGIKIVRRLEGMFAFGLWDPKKQQLILVRDQFGIKPLYYVDEERRFMFASEIKPLLAAGHKVKPNKHAVIEYFTVQNMICDETLFEGVKMLRPGTVMIVRPGKRPEKRNMVAFSPRLLQERSFPPDEIRRKVEAAVQRHLVSDVPVGSYLSGGIDSSAIAVLAKPDLKVAVVGGFKEEKYDERPWAELIAKMHGLNHQAIEITEDAMWGCLPKLVWHLEDLRMGPSYPVYLVAKEAARHVKVCLSGLGSDEIFAGYPWHYKPVAEAKDDLELVDRLIAYWQRLVPVSGHRDFFAKEFLGGKYKTPLHELRKVVRGRCLVRGKTRLDTNLQTALNFDILVFLPSLLTMEDKLSMAHSLEVRFPFLDRDLVRDILSVRVTTKLQDFSPTGGKLLLRMAMDDLLPADVLFREKVGFNPPDAEWFRSEKSMAVLVGLLLSERFGKRGIFRLEQVRAILGMHYIGKDHRSLIWSLVCFELWCRIFLDGEKPEEVRL